MSSELIQEIICEAVERSKQPTPTTQGAFGEGTLRQLCYEELVRRLPIRPEHELETEAANVIPMFPVDLLEPVRPQLELPEEWSALVEILWPEGLPHDVPYFNTTELPWAMAGRLERMANSVSL